MAGRSAQAIEASTTLTSKVNLDAARQVGMLQEMLPYHALTLTTFGKWDDVLAEPLPPEDIRFSYAMASYARGVAHAAKGQWAEAQAALDTVTINAATPEGADGKTALSIAVHALSGEIATRRGDLDAGIKYFRRRPRSRTRTLLRTAQVVLPDSALARRRAVEGGTTCRGREGVSRGPPALPRERPRLGSRRRSGRRGRTPKRPQRKRASAVHGRART